MFAAELCAHDDDCLFLIVRNDVETMTWKIFAA
jgi:hypothetical protein